MWRSCSPTSTSSWTTSSRMLPRRSVTSWTSSPSACQKAASGPATNCLPWTIICSPLQHAQREVHIGHRHAVRERRRDLVTRARAVEKRDEVTVEGAPPVGSTVGPTPNNSSGPVAFGRTPGLSIGVSIIASSRRYGIASEPSRPGPGPRVATRWSASRGTAPRSTIRPRSGRRCWPPADPQVSYSNGEQAADDVQADTRPHNAARLRLEHHFGTRPLLQTRRTLPM